jgi:hypothetical protein
MPWQSQDIGIVFAEADLVWITQVIQLSVAPGIAPSYRRAGLQKRFSYGSMKLIHFLNIEPACQQGLRGKSLSNRYIV